MVSDTICPVILAGGSGKRLWPVSRSQRPKQFAKLSGQDTLLADTVRRLEDVGCGAPVFVTQDRYRWAVSAEAEALGLVDHRIVLEPEARGTAAAICAVAELIVRDGSDQLMLIAPSDQVMFDTLALAEAVSRGAEVARSGGIVVFGVKPTRPETGYGYIEVSELRAKGGASRFLRFVEKPNSAQAEEMLENGYFLWNAGLFLVSAKTVLAHFAELAPDIASAARSGANGAETDLAFIRLGQGFSKAPADAFDYAIMEKAEGWVVPLDAGWSDLGTWQGIWSVAPKDDAGNASFGNTTTINCADSLFFSEDSDVELVAIGLTNIAAISTRDAVLVVDLNDSQAVAQAVERLEAKGVQQADTFRSDHRPWGHFETLAQGPRFKVKSIVVNPGGTLSLQSHRHRAEHWVVVEGTATVTIDGNTQLVTENQVVYIPMGAHHRLANGGRQDLRLIEVQTGTYLAEDDIVRFEDVYSRT